MLQKLSGQITDCWARAEEAEQRALDATDPALRAGHESIARTWRHLARSYEFVQSLERFLLDAERAKVALSLGRTICCRSAAAEYASWESNPISTAAMSFHLNASLAGTLKSSARRRGKQRLIPESQTASNESAINNFKDKL